MMTSGLQAIGLGGVLAAALVLAACGAEQRRGDATSREDVKSVLKVEDDGPGFTSRVYLCETRDACTSLAVLYPPAQMSRAELSADERFTAIVFTSDEAQREAGKLTVDVLDHRADRRVGRFELIARGEVRWTPFDTLVHAWTAGSDVAEVEVIAPDGREVWSDGGPAASLSPCRRHALIFPHRGTPMAASHAVVLHDLRDGTELQRLDDLGSTGYVRAVRWGERHLTFEVVDAGAEPRRVVWAAPCGAEP